MGSGSLLHKQAAGCGGIGVGPEDQAIDFVKIAPLRKLKRKRRWEVFEPKLRYLFGSLA